MFSLFHVKQTISIILVISMLTTAIYAEPTQVSLVKDPKGVWSLQRGGKPFLVQGVGGSGSIKLAKEVGVNSVRTWGIEQLEFKDAEGRSFIDQADQLGLTVCVGLWVKHERHGFKYSDPKFIAKQREEIVSAVRKYKNHPAVLVWGLGNEMESYVGTEDAIRVWRELEELAKLIKQEDPNHPVIDRKSVM